MESEHHDHSVPEPGDPDDDNILATLFLVLMEAAKSAQEDLAAILEQLKQINRQREALRRVADGIHGRHADLVRDLVDRQLDSLSEMGEMESLRLQMTMERLSKLASTLSNLLKKSSDTAAGIIANMK